MTIEFTEYWEPMRKLQEACMEKAREGLESDDLNLERLTVLAEIACKIEALSLQWATGSRSDAVPHPLKPFQLT